MATFIMLGHFSDQGIRSVKDTTKRVETVKAAAKKLGITVKDVYWTLGQYDTVLIAEAPDEATMTAFGLELRRVKPDIRTAQRTVDNVPKQWVYLGFGLKEL